MNANLNKIFNESTKMPIMVGVGSFIAGVGVTLGVSYIRNRKTPKVETSPHKFPTTGTFTSRELDNFIIQERKRLGIGHQPVPELEDEKEPEEVPQPDPSEVGKEFVEKKMEEIIPLISEDEPVELESRNVFAGSDDDWDYETEVKSRSSSAPYVLHKDEFYADELNYSQISLTYYAGDDILVDEEDAPIYNHNQVVGPMLFGHGADQTNVFYVRSDKRRAEYEIIRDPGMYSVEILGLSLEKREISNDLRHSRHTPRFHMD